MTEDFRRQVGLQVLLRKASICAASAKAAGIGHQPRPLQVTRLKRGDMQASRASATPRYPWNPLFSTETVGGSTRANRPEACLYTGFALRLPVSACELAHPCPQQALMQEGTPACSFQTSVPHSRLEPQTFRMSKSAVRACRIQGTCAATMVPWCLDSVKDQDPAGRCWQLALLC